MTNVKTFAKRYMDLIPKKKSRLKDKLSTHHMRVQYLKKCFEYVKPRCIEFRTIRNKVSFCMDLPIAKTLTKLMSNESLWKIMINDPIFTSLQSVSFKWFKVHLKFHYEDLKNQCKIFFKIRFSTLLKHHQLDIIPTLHRVFSCLWPDQNSRNFLSTTVFPLVLP